MQRRQKWIVFGVIFAFVVLAAPVAFTFMASRGLRGIYESSGSCACGHTLFQYIDETGYYDFVPGHGSKELRYALREGGANQWVGIKNNTNAVLFRLQDGEVHTTYAMSTNSFKEERVYNVWRVWIPQILGE